MTGTKFETYEGPNNAKMADMPPPDFMRQVAEMRNTFDFKNIHTTDTSARYTPQVTFYDSARPVDGLQTNAGRTFKFDKDGNARYTVTGKDHRGLNEVVKDYMTTRDGRAPSPDQIRRIVDQIAKDPANGIKDVNNIRQGQNLRFPGPEQATRVPDVRLPGQPPMDWRHAVPHERPSVPPPGYERTPQRTGEQPTKNFADATGLDIYRRQEDVNVNFDGTVTKRFNGAVRDGFVGLDRTQAHGYEKTDRNGKVIETEVNLASSKDMRIPKPEGGEEVVTFNKMRVTYNADGSYRTELTKEDGSRVSFRTNSNGTRQRY